jgi:hypothetical protein
MNIELLQFYYSPDLTLTNIAAACQRAGAEQRLRACTARKGGVSINNIFEHLEATIAEATPLYELCASVLTPAPPLGL